MLQCVRKVITPWLRHIFRRCLSFNYVPISWRRVKVIFIPKIGRRGHGDAKDFRPISLSSFLLKTLERLIDTRIRRDLESSSRMSVNQHAYLKGRSTETALHDVVTVIERSLHFKQYTLGAFLDIEGAFNNVKSEAIGQALLCLEVEDRLRGWILSMLDTRMITAEWGNSARSGRVRRGTPQGGVLSPLLWLAVINSVLIEFETQGVRVIAYADDVVILVSGRFMDVISDIMTNALGTLSEWASNCGLGVNPSKTELVLFTTKTKIPSFRLPQLQGCGLTLSGSAKYLGVILDSKLSWKLNVEHRVQRATVAFYACRRMFGSRWGLRTKMVVWLYTAIVRPILTYGAIVWWPATDKRFVTDRLYRVQRSACLGATGALRTCPAEALNVMLHLMPIDLYVKAVAAVGAVRLSASDRWRDRDYGHARALHGLPPGLDRRTDHITPRLSFSRPFVVEIPSRRDWTRRDPTRGYDRTVYTDGSKMSCGVGSGVFSGDPYMGLSFRLPDDASVFQAEILAIREACRRICSDGTRGRVGIFVDSQAALLSLCSSQTSSILVGECKEELSRLCRTSSVTLVWVPGHRDVYGNECADELARKGSSLDGSAAMWVGVPFGTLRKEILGHFFLLAGRRWADMTTCGIARQTWPCYDLGRSRSLLGRNRRDMSRLVAVLTGHWLIGRHAQRLGVAHNDVCRSCRSPGEEETVRHLLCDCAALNGMRSRFLGGHFLDNLTEISGARIGDLVRFLDYSGWI